MRELIIGCALLLVLLGLGALTQYAVETIHEPVASDLEQACVAARRGDWGGALTLSRQARRRWEDTWQITAALADQTPMEQIDNLFACLEIYTGDRERFAACCAELSTQTRAVGELHRISWWNIL